MLIINNTFQVDSDIVPQWREFSVHYFLTVKTLEEVKSIRFQKVHYNDKQTETFCIQILAIDKIKASFISESVLPEYFGAVKKNFGEKAVWFTSIIEEALL